MTNPLARVVMNTVIKKTGEGNKVDSYKKEINLTSKEEDIITRLIRGEKGVEVENKTVTPITLDEAANRLRK